MEQRPCWEADSRSASHISGILCYWKVHYHVYNNPLMVPMLSQSNPAHTLKFTSFYFPLLNPLRRISPSSRPCATFRNVFLFTVRCIQLSAQHPNWRTTAYSRPAQRAARGQHVAPDTLLCCPW